MREKELYWTMFIWIGSIMGSIIGFACGKEFFNINLISFYGLISGTVGGLVGIGIGYLFTKWLNDWIY